MRRPKPLYDRVVEIDECIAGDEVLQAASDEGCRACAVVLVHGYRHTEHERRVVQMTWQSP